jgi:hypothetical protein
MPTLPNYESQKTITQRKAGPKSDPIDTTLPEDPGKKIAKKGQEILQKWSDANDVMQYTEAKSAYETGVADISSRAAADPDFKNTDEYRKELDTLRNNSVNMISNQAVAGRAGIEFDSGNEIAGIKIDAQFKQKQLKYNKVELGNTLDKLVQKKLTASTSEKAAIELEIAGLLAAQQALGVITPKEADEFFKAARKTEVQYAIYADTSTREEDSELLKELQDPKGEYAKKLDPDTRLDLIQDAQRRIFQNNQSMKKEFEVAKKSRSESIYEKIGDGTLTFADLDAEEDAPEGEKLPQKVINAHRKALKNEHKLALPKIVTNNDDAAKYIEAIDLYIDNVDDTDKAIEYIVNAYAVDGLDAKEALFLEQLQGQARGIAHARGRADFMKQDWIPFKNAINAIHDFWFPVGNEKAHALTIHSMISAVASGKDPIQAKNDAILEAIIRENPRISNFSKEGQLVVDAYGNRKIMFPDGTTKEAPPLKIKTEGSK